MPTSPIEKQLSSSETEIPVYGAEVEQFHTRIMRVSLAVEESRAYWEHGRSSIPKENRSLVAFEERWFGSKSMARVKTLLAEFNHRFDAYPIALEVLHYWRPNDPATRQVLCHWHMQLADPLYRLFSGFFLEERRSHPTPTIDRDIVARWVSQQLNNEWSSSTTIRTATGLMTSAAAAGLCSGGAGTRTLKYPTVTDEALAYWLYFLRYLSFSGSLLDNPYLASVGLNEGFLEQRLRRLPDLSFSRMGELQDFGWHFPDLKSWATHALDLKWEGQE